MFRAAEIIILTKNKETNKDSCIQAITSHIFVQRVF